MRRGEVWWASLPAPDGSGPGMRRPVLIVQSNPFNESRIATVIVAIVTSNLGLAQARATCGLAGPTLACRNPLSSTCRSF
jgi:mRNA interferase MazF